MMLINIIYYVLYLCYLMDITTEHIFLAFYPTESFINIRLRHTQTDTNANKAAYFLFLISFIGIRCSYNSFIRILQIPAHGLSTKKKCIHFNRRSTMQYFISKKKRLCCASESNNIVCETRQLPQFDRQPND